MVAIPHYLVYVVNSEPYICLLLPAVAVLIVLPFLFVPESTLFVVFVLSVSLFLTYE